MVNTNTIHVQMNMCEWMCKCALPKKLLKFNTWKFKPLSLRSGILGNFNFLLDSCQVPRTSPCWNRLIRRGIQVTISTPCLGLESYCTRESWHTEGSERCWVWFEPQHRTHTPAVLKKRTSQSCRYFRGVGYRLTLQPEHMRISWSFFSV